MSQTFAVIFLSSDLMFYSQISSAARSAGLASLMVKNAQELTTKTDPSNVQWVLVDLFQSKTEVAELAVELKRICANARILGFGPHVDGDVLNAAREAGFDDVMPRSKFHNLLPRLFVPAD